MSNTKHLEYISKQNTMEPFVNNDIDLGFSVCVKGGSSTIRRWAVDNNFHPMVPPVTLPSRLIGIIREPHSRFISQIYQRSNVFAQNNLHEDPQAFDRAWTELHKILTSGKLNGWHSLDPHFAKQVTTFNEYPITEYWDLRELDEKLQPIIDEYGFTQPERFKTANPNVKEKIKSAVEPLKDIIEELYKEDFALYAKITN